MSGERSGATIPTQTCALCGAEWVTVHSCPVTPTVRTPLLEFDIVPPAQERKITSTWRVYDTAMVDRLIVGRDAMRDLLRRLNDELGYEIGCAGLDVEVGLHIGSSPTPEADHER
jgi:hypothetical protein